MCDIHTKLMHDFVFRRVEITIMTCADFGKQTLSIEINVGLTKGIQTGWYRK